VAKGGRIGIGRGEMGGVVSEGEAIDPRQCPARALVRSRFQADGGGAFTDQKALALVIERPAAVPLGRQDPETFEA
jgi:hypothetical protein